MRYQKRFNPEWISHPRKRQSPEGHIQLQIIRYLRSIGAIVGKTKTMGVKRGNTYCFDIYTMRGKADLEAFYKGVMYAIECKAPGKSIKENSDQDKYRSYFHKPPDRIFIEADCLEDVQSVIS